MAGHRTSAATASSRDLEREPPAGAPILGRDLGRLYRSFPPVLSRVERLLFRQVELDAAELARQLVEHPRLTYVIAHGGAISWLPITIALLQRLAELAPDRMGTGTFHKGLWKLPGVAATARFFSGAQRHMTYPELAAALAGGDCDFFAFPESDGALYGDLSEIKPFRFHRFIELSVEARMPMLLVAHKGSEAWYRSPSLLTALLSQMPARAFSFFHIKKDEFLAHTAREQLNLPVPLGRIALEVRTAPLVPLCFERGLSADRDEKRAQLAQEAERIRVALQALTDSI